MAGGDTASAPAAGCPVVVKAHPGHPETLLADRERVLPECFGPTSVLIEYSGMAEVLAAAPAFGGNLRPRCTARTTRSLSRP